MMNFDNLLKIIPELKPISKRKLGESLAGICDTDFPIEHSLIFIKNKKYFEKALEQKLPSLGFIISEKLIDRVEELEKFNPLFVASVENIDLSVSLLSKPFYDQKINSFNSHEAKVSSTAILHEGSFVGKNVVIGENVILYPGAIIMDNCSVGDGSIIFPNTTLYPFVNLGKNVRIHSGSVIGADGFGYNYDGGIHHKVWHMGGVSIEDSVEVGANSQIDGGTFSPTIIGAGTKLDNNVQIGHNCRLGKGVLICGHVAIGGTSSLGDFTVFGGKSGMGDNMTLGKGCKVAGGALVNTDWPDGTVLGGHPARPLKEWMRGIAFVRKESLKK